MKALRSRCKRLGQRRKLPTAWSLVAVFRRRLTYRPEFPAAGPRVRQDAAAWGGRKFEKAAVQYCFRVVVFDFAHFNRRPSPG
jgi:hypothetical protein